MSEAASTIMAAPAMREASVLEAMVIPTRLGQRLSRNQISARAGVSYYHAGRILRDLVGRELVSEWDVPEMRHAVYDLTEEGLGLMTDHHPCPECGHVCASAESLERHMLREHGRVAEEDLLHGSSADDAGQECIGDTSEESEEPQLSSEPKAIVRYCQWPKRPDEEVRQWDTIVHSECCPDFRKIWHALELRIRPNDSGFEIYDRYGKDRAVHFCPSCGKRIEFQAVLYRFSETSLEVLL